MQRHIYWVHTDETSSTGQVNLHSTESNHTLVYLVKKTNKFSKVDVLHVGTENRSKLLSLTLDNKWDNSTKQLIFQMILIHM